MAQPLWYLRHAGTLLGPYPPPQVEELLGNGAITGEWEISLDQQDWLPIRDSGQFADRDAAWRAEHAGVQQAWIEERQRARERWQGEEGDLPLAHDAALDEDRRAALGRDQVRTERLVNAELARRPSLLIGLLALLALGVIGIVVWLGQSAQPIQASLSQAVNCAAAAGEGVNWSACDKRSASLAGAMLRNAHLDRARLEAAQMPGAVLEYASAVEVNLRNADLRGAKLTAADLSGADLSGADLSGANLRHAVLKGTRLDGTRFDHAVWSDGRHCAAGSVGACL